MHYAEFQFHEFLTSTPCKFVPFIKALEMGLDGLIRDIKLPCR
jgi:hypothetical protein